VPAGHVFRIVAVEGPQVGDLTCGTSTIRASGCGRRAPATPGRSRDGVRPPVVDLALSAADGDHHVDSLAGYGIDDYGGRIP